MREKSHSKNKGYLFIEAMVAISIIVLGILGMVVLLSRSLSINRVISDQFDASYLASEGVEVVKNIIDANIIQGRPWNDGLGNGDFEVAYNSLALEPDSNRRILFDAGTGRFGYQAGAETFFVRTISLEQIDDDCVPGAERIRVNSLVKWKTRGGGDFEINLEDNFFDWRSGGAVVCGGPAPGPGPGPVSNCIGSGTVNHSGADWTPNSGDSVCGLHVNINNFRINGGDTVYVQPYDGVNSNYGFLEVQANNNIQVLGTLTASGAGYGGGGGGAGGSPYCNFLNCSPGGTCGPTGSGGSGILGGANGAGGNCGSSGAGGGNGGGSYGGNGGSPGNSSGCGGSGPSGGTGGNGGYAAVGSNGDSSTNESLNIGSGGGGAGGGSSPECSGPSGYGGGGGAGNRGGGYIKLIANNMTLNGSVSTVGLANSSGNAAAGTDTSCSADIFSTRGSDGGNAGSNGSSAPSGHGGFMCSSYSASDGGAGGSGAGGGALLKGNQVILSGGSTIDASGGGGNTINGGTVKIFSDSLINNGFISSGALCTGPTAGPCSY